jgi:hypothetical protein
MKHTFQAIVSRVAELKTDHQCKRGCEKVWRDIW